MKTIYLLTGIAIASFLCIPTMAQDQLTQSQLLVTTEQASQTFDELKKLKEDIEKLKADLITVKEGADKEKNQTAIAKQIKDKQKEERNRAIKYADKIQGVMELTTDLIYNTLSTANLFSNVANAMKVVDSLEATKIDKATIKAERFWNASGDILGIAGALASTIVIVDDPSKSKEALVGLSISSVGRIIFKSIAKKKEKSNSLTYIHNKATQLSIHSFLVLKIRSVSNYMIDLANQNRNLIVRLKGNRAVIKFPTKEGQAATISLPELRGLNVIDNWKDIETLISTADDVLRLIYQVDNLYNVELSLLQKEVQQRSEFKVYTTDGRNSLSNLEQSIIEARDSWKNVRYFYTKVETNLASFRESSPNILELAKTKIE
jgi:hypothetical protein